MENMDSFSVFHASTLSQTVAGLAQNSTAVQRAKVYGLDIVRVAWEDTARDEMSSGGKNICDMTLRLAKENVNLPVLRYPNFSDRTLDVDIDQFKLTVGNEVDDGSPLHELSLAQYLRQHELLLPRDTKILTSVQYCFLPLESGECEFNVQLYNYQTQNEEDPAVLVIVASDEGTSSQTVKEDQTILYFNNQGQAANYIAKRLKEVRKEEGKPVDGPMTLEEQARNTLVIYQVPLKQTGKKFVHDPLHPRSKVTATGIHYTERSLPMMLAAAAPDPMGADDAQLSVGKSHGKFPAVTQKLVRDGRYPIRATIQFYGVTDTADLPPAVYKKINGLFEALYAHWSGGSLVVDGESRPTSSAVLDPLDVAPKPPKKKLSPGYTIPGSTALPVPSKGLVAVPGPALVPPPGTMTAHPYYSRSSVKAVDFEL